MPSSRMARACSALSSRSSSLSLPRNDVVFKGMARATMLIATSLLSLKSLSSLKIPLPKTKIADKSVRYYCKPTLYVVLSISLKQRLFLGDVVCVAEVFIRLLRSLATTGCALEESLLNEEGFVYLLHGACLLANCRCHGV